MVSTVNGLILFEDNKARDGGVHFISHHASVIFTESSVVTFRKNAAKWTGGAIFLSFESMISFEESSIVLFDSNRATYGGVIHSNESSDLL